MRRRKRRALGVSLMVLVGALSILVAYPGLVFGTTLPAPAGVTLDVSVGLSAPKNGSYLVPGEQAEVTVTLKDKSGATLNRSDFATLNLYAYGPQETAKTRTAAKLLNANTDRSKQPHHYIDLLANPGVRADGSTLKYTLQPVSDEEAGTYTATVWAVKKGDSLNQTFALADFQLGTATVEQQIVASDNCAKCHLGASNGQFYMHHVDPSERGPNGNRAIDSVPVRTCKSCHNNDGYAAITSPVDGKSVFSDQIVYRVHGVHNGADLKNPANIDPQKGVFKDYLGVEFPADVKNCAYCHTDDRWKTKPSRLACGACHDNVDFGDPANMGPGMKAHPGGPQSSDANCATCHTADTGALAVSKVHDPSVNVQHDDVALTMSAPANGKFYVAGERPVLTIVIKDSNGNPIDHTQIDKTLSIAQLFVYGPREGSKPVLTTAARLGASVGYASTASTIPASGDPKGWSFDAGDTFKIALNGEAPRALAAPAGQQTTDQVVAWLKAQLGSAATVTASGPNVTIRSNLNGGEKSRIEIYDSPVTAKMGWKPVGLDVVEHGKVVGQTVGTTMEPFVVIGAPSTVANNLLGSSDPAATRTADSITYQLDDVAGLQPGTYMVQMYTNIAGVNTSLGWPRSAFGHAEFQIGTATPEPKVAGNCATCHANTVMHLNESHVHPAQFDPDQCKACHDYQRFGTGEGFSRTGGNSTLGWSGYGAKPIAARVHGVHFGAYLDHPEDVYAGNPNMASEIIFPQDVRNCVVCHDPKTTSNAWQAKPSRLACMACHDSDAAQNHAKAMTFYPNPSDTYSDDKGESCVVCHGIGRDFAVAKVHNISGPYKPPYPRERE
ncbi:MAG TPA: hypothetical protein VF960_13900 [Chloroflexota bacterium]